MESTFALRIKDKILTTAGFKRYAGPRLRVLPDDVFVVSYPRSGNTWVRFLLGNLIHGKELDFHNMDRLVPDIYRCTHRYLENLPRPRYLKSHEPYDVRYQKVIYLVRDPRDVAISYFRWMQKFRRTEQSFEDFVVDFVENRTRYGGWANHIRGWCQNAETVPGGFLMVRYEDMLSTPAAKLKDMAEFLDLDIQTDDIELAVNNNRFEKMREKETAAGAEGLFKGARSDIRFVRKGTFGQWQDQLTGKQLSFFAAAFADIMVDLGYDPGS